MVEIEIDHQECTPPPECAKCLQSCPQGVFMNYPRDRRTPGGNAGDWVVVPVQMTLCTGCRICEDVCPHGAVTVTVTA